MRERLYYEKHQGIPDRTKLLKRTRTADNNTSGVNGGASISTCLLKEYPFISKYSGSGVAWSDARLSEDRINPEEM